MPKPSKGETEKKFVSRCIPIVISDRTTDDISQAAAICHSIWDKEKKVTMQGGTMGEKLTNERSNLRKSDPENLTENCKNCVFFQSPNSCKIVVGPVSESLLCDWIQSRGLVKDPQYDVKDEDWLAFGRGMVAEQPYQHIVKDVALTPEGPLVLIEDTAKPKHKFSLSKAFHIGHTTLEHHWTQKEVDRLIAKGKKKMEETKMSEEKETTPETPEETAPAPATQPAEQPAETTEAAVAPTEAPAAPTEPAAAPVEPTAPVAPVAPVVEPTPVEPAQTAPAETPAETPVPTLTPAPAAPAPAVPAPVTPEPVATKPVVPVTPTTPTPVVVPAEQPAITPEEKPVEKTPEEIAKEKAQKKDDEFVDYIKKSWGPRFPGMD